MYLLLITLLCALTNISLNADAVDDFIQEKSTAILALSTIDYSMSFEARVNAANALRDEINTEKIAVAETATAEQLTTLNKLMLYCEMDAVLAQLEIAISSPLLNIATFTLSTSIATFNSVSASAINDLNSYADIYSDVNNALPAASNAFEEELFARFNSVITRIGFIMQSIPYLQLFSADYPALVAAQNAIPDRQDESIGDYDSVFLAAQNAIEENARSVVADLEPLLALMTLAGENDTSSNNTLDVFVYSSLELKDSLTRFYTHAQAVVAGVTLARKDVALRILQKNLLFDAITNTDKITIKNSIAATLAQQSTATTEFQSTVATATAFLNVTPSLFEETPPPAAPEGSRSNMAVIVDTKVTEYFTNLTATMRTLFPSPPNQETIDAIVTTLSPAVYLQMLSTAMVEWLTDRMNVLEPLTGATLATRIADCGREWSEFVALLLSTLTSPILSPSIAPTLIGAITATMTLEQFAALISNLTTATEFTQQAYTLIRRPSGFVRQIMTQGSFEFQRLILSLINQIQRGSVTMPATITTNAPASTTAVKTVPGQPNTTIDSTTTLTTTLNNGDQILITGTGTLAARLRDPVFNNTITNKLTASLKIFLNKSARIGLGTANITNTPGQTPNVLGGSDAENPNSVQIVPDGNCFVDVNSDLIISGSKPIVPTANFGTNTHTLTFYSEVPRTITVTANTTWDLSDFGSCDNRYVNYGKQIVFAGKVSLVLESGAKIRFPHVNPSNKNKTVVLYFNDNARLICQGDPLLIGNPWTDSVIAGSDCRRNKFLGMGQIWFNKNAVMTIHKPALVGIEADYVTPKTDITFSLQRNAQILIGTKDVPGGALQVGNMFYGGSKEIPHSNAPDPHFPNSSVNADNNFEPHTTTIDFTLSINGDAPLFQIGRQGFFGLAAGVVNKDGAPNSSNAGPNGITGIANSAWQLQHLYNVGNITLDITQGTFDHSIITDGSAGDCSMIAISRLATPFPYSKYLLRIGNTGAASILGGGTLYFVDRDASMTLDSNGAVTPNPHTVTIANTAADLSFNVTNTGTYAPMAPGIGIKARQENVTSGSTTYTMFGRGVVDTTGSVPYVFAGPTEEFFAALKLNNADTKTNQYIPASFVGNTPTIAYLSDNVIYRVAPSNTALRDGVFDDAISLYGYVRSVTRGVGNRSSLAMPLE